MNHGPANILSSLLRLALLALSAWVFPALADDYATVNQLIRAGKLVEAQTKADQYLAGKPRDPQMRFLKGVIQREQGKTSDALATFTRLTEDYPELPEPYNNLAVIYAGQGQFDKARAALEMAIRTNPSYATAHENLGDIYAKLASQAYNKALLLDGNNAAAAQPKLAMIREVFNPQAKGQRPTQPAAPQPAPAPSPAAPAHPAAPVTPATPASKATPPAPAPTPTPAAPVGEAAATANVEAAVQAWAKAWAAKDMKGYLGAYGAEFDPPGQQSRKAWEEERRQRILSKNNIQLRLEGLKVTVNGNRAEATFRQHYKADTLSVSSRKTLTLTRSGERWVIVREATGT